MISAILRGWFGPEPMVGQLWEFDEDKPAWDPPFRVRVTRIDRHWIGYQYVWEEEDAAPRGMRKTSFRIVYRPTKTEPHR